MAASKPKPLINLKLTTLQATSLVALGTLSLVLAFYLGFTSGKSLRSPEADLLAPLPQDGAGEEVSPEQMQFFQLAEEPADEPAIDLENLSKLRERTSVLADEVNQAEVSAQAGEAGVPAPPSPSKPVAVVPSPAPEKPKPIPPKPVPAPDRTYTIQVAAYRVLKMAEDMVTRLNENGFREAYVDKYVSQTSQVWYRVRVGKLTRGQANSEATRLKRLNFVSEANITRL